MGIQPAGLKFHYQGKLVMNLGEQDGLATMDGRSRLPEGRSLRIRRNGSSVRLDQEGALRVPAGLVAREGDGLVPSDNRGLRFRLGNRTLMECFHDNNQTGIQLAEYYLDHHL